MTAADIAIKQVATGCMTIDPHQNNALRFQRIRARRARGEEDTEQTTEANLMSLKDYRNYVEIENKILARRKSHPFAKI